MLPPATPGMMVKRQGSDPPIFALDAADTWSGILPLYHPLGVAPPYPSDVPRDRIANTNPDGNPIGVVESSNNLD